ncbi:Glucosidase 2 subunit beta-like protein [Drosera capensis]
METPLLLLLLSLSLVLDPSTSTVRSSSVPNPLLGVAPQDEKYYDGSSGFIRCKDGSKRLERSRVNDDFCDCPDGSDEPGTSACPNGRFYCQNVGHVATVLYSSRVNDGICDCCDGSDEYDGKVNCRNTCWEAGKAARDKLTKKIKTYQDGVTLRRKEVEQARQAYANDKAELSKLQNEEKILKGLVELLKECKGQIEKEEEKQRLEREKKEKSIKEAEKEAELEEEVEEEVENGNDKPVQDTDHDVIGNVEHSSGQGGEEVHENSEAENDANSSIEETTTDEVDQVERNDEELKDLSVGATGRQEESAAPENTEGLSKEELGRLVASRWTGESTGQKPGESNFLNDDEDDVLHKEDHGYESEINDGNDDDSDQGYDDDHDFEDHMDEDSSDVHGISGSSYGADSEDESILSDVTASNNPSWLEKIKRTVRRLLSSVNLFQAPLNITDAARVCKEYDKSFTKLSELQSRISSLSQKLKHDFGPEKEFYLFYDRCFESKQNKRWEKFEESYRVMLFANGDRCWNGPDRSLKVRLRCGLENEIANVDEPSRCEYVAVLSTPNVCHEEKLKELQQKLDALNKDQPPNHDEL